MSRLAEIFQSYKNALDQSHQQYEALYTDRLENGRVFYHAFFHQLIIPFRPRFTADADRAALTAQIEHFFGTREIAFVAIDGTCYKDAFSDMVIFFGGAYGARGRLTLTGDPPRVHYEKWGLDRDVSLVAWVPVPFAELTDVAGADPIETFLVTDADRINLSNIHTSLMQLAEIYLAYLVASAPDPPHLIMLDQSLSGLIAATSHGVETGLVAGEGYGPRRLQWADVLVAFAHPFNTVLQVPSTKRFRRYTAILAAFHQRNVQTLSRADLETALHLPWADLEDGALFLQRNGLGTLTADGTLTLRVDCRAAWAETVDLFRTICARLFQAKDPNALTYLVTDLEHPGRSRRRWLAPDDVLFLIAVGLRALIEICWDRHIMLVGVVKDSESRYLTRNYLGVMKHLGLYPELRDLTTGPLPWTDRIYLETIPIYCDTTLEAPWASIEFDATFMTTHLGTTETGTPQIMGVRTQRGEMVAPERLFLRSLAQFFLARQKKTPLAGHVVFLDRLAMPEWDATAFGEVSLTSPSLGTLQPLVYRDRTATNIGQAVMMYLLTTLTRNHFPEVIGYPDPLHKADWGAKSLGRRVRDLIASGDLPFRSRPIAKTLRRLREEGGR